LSQEKPFKLRRVKRRVMQPVEYAFTRLLCFMVNRLPPGAAVRLGGAVGRWMFSPFGVRRKVCMKNLEVAFPDMPLEERRDVAKRSYANLGRTMAEILMMERIDRVFDSGRPMQVEDAVEVGTKFVYSESVLSPIKDASGRMFAVGVLYRDVTARKKMERRIAEALDLNQKIISASSLGLAAYHSSGQCVFANQSAARIVGATAEQFLEQNFNRIESWKKSGLLEAARQVLSDGREQRLEIHTVSSFDKDVWLDCQLNIFTTAGEAHLLLIFDDITQRKEMENRLRQQNLALEDSNQELERANRQILEHQKSIIEEERLKVLLQMAGATAHELNQPLMALLGYIELMAMDRNNPEKVGKYSDQIEDAGRRIAEIVRKIQTIRHDEVKHYAGETTILNLDKPIDILSVEDNDLDFQRIKATLDQTQHVRIERAEDIEVGFEVASPVEIAGVETGTLSAGREALGLHGGHHRQA